MLVLHEFYLFIYFNVEQLGWDLLQLGAKIRLCLQFWQRNTQVPSKQSRQITVATVARLH